MICQVFHQLLYTAIVRRCNRYHGVKAELMKFQLGLVFSNAVNLVDAEHDMFGLASQNVRYFFIHRNKSGPAVNQKHNQICLTHSTQRLIRHGRIEGFRGTTQATGINQDIRPATDLAITVLTITGQTR